ncbi:GNAT family N-acetyltransferase [Bacterioplanes sanyensis]|uniref:GNAT family N-acetyltransferase n=1 Tax=Bacterioplanes sanyensis TaxID=1249553 RepID=UPI0018EE715D|nr:GNAT family N-acetyltransferase [Bacterioplanes sanyensis]
MYASRIILRTIQKADGDDLFEIYADAKTMQFASDPVFSSRAMIEQMLDSVARLEQSGESLEWAIVERQSSKVIGTCGLHSFSDNGQSCEVGCLLEAPLNNSVPALDRQRISDHEAGLPL